MKHIYYVFMVNINAQDKINGVNGNRLKEKYKAIEYQQRGENAYGWLN